MAIIKDATKMSALYYNAEKIGKGYVGTNLVYESVTGPLFSFVPSVDMDGKYIIGYVCTKKMDFGGYIGLNVSAKAGDEVVVTTIPQLTEEYPYYCLDVEKLSLVGVL